MKKTILLCLINIFVLSSFLSLWGHIGDHPSVHDIVAAIKRRLKETLPPEKLANIDVPTLLENLTDEEKQVLGTEHLRFTVNVPVRVFIAHDIRLEGEPFWLDDRGFEKTAMKVMVDKREFDVWQKDFDKGEIGLGINSLQGGKKHYFVMLAKQDTQSKNIEVTDVYPAFHFVERAKIGAKPFVDESDEIKQISPELLNKKMIRTFDDRVDVGKLIGIFLATQYPSSDRPDHVVLTWSEDPRFSQTVQWRTNLKVKKGLVGFQKKDDFLANGLNMDYVTATTNLLETPDILNDAEVFRHTAVIRDLQPGTTYIYSVGADRGLWSEQFEFTTAPEGPTPFSFVYMGDAQNGLDVWGQLVQKSLRDNPQVSFFLMAGDLINRGAERDDWDSFFENAKGVFNNRQMMPAIGNHEVQGGHPTLYLKHFTLPDNGPKGIERGRAYSFEYGNACFIVLDTTLLPFLQMEWLDQQLAKTKATWKFVMYHHPAYSSRVGSDNLFIRELWTPIFDKYHVDLALQGHDHAYLRTYPMKDKKKVATPNEGTVYIVSVSGTKMYEQDPHDYTEVGFTDIATYQVLDIEIAGKRLTYKAYDGEGVLRDEFVIEK